jgi:hypothetical protein
MLGWQDTSLEIECAFQALPSGQLVCLPSGEDTAWSSGDDESSWYGDSECTSPVRELQFGSSCRTPRFAQVMNGDETVNRCQLEPSYVRVGAQVDSVYQKLGNECQLVSPLPSPSSILARGFYEVEPFAIEGFVAGMLQDSSEADGIVLRRVTSEDGARGFWSFHDAAGDFDCQLATMAEGVRCVPTNMPMVTGINFADPGCESPAAMAIGCSLAQQVPYAIEGYALNGDNDVLYVVEGGPRLQVSYTGSSGADACVEFHNDEGVFAVGARVAGSKFTTGMWDETRDELGLIVRVAHAGGWSFTGAWPLRSEQFMGYDCVYLPTQDGVVRCVPGPGLSGPEYADAECTQAVIDGWGTTTAVAFADGQCSPRVEIYARGEEYSGPIYRKDGEQCVFARDQPAQPARSIAHRVGEELPPADFPAISISLR